MLGHFKAKRTSFFSFHSYFPPFPLQELGSPSQVFQSTFFYGSEENRPREEEEDKLELPRTSASSQQPQEVFHTGGGDVVP